MNQPGSFTCHCANTGYVGDNCEIDIDECDNDQPCQNGGICINNPGMYDCICNSTGYQGKTCEEDINECEIGEPCQNGGTCINQAGAFICACAANYTGQFCEKELQPPGMPSHRQICALVPLKS